MSSLCLPHSGDSHPMCRMARLSVLLLASCGTAAGAYAQQAGPGGPGGPGGAEGAKGSSWSLGVAAISMQDPYKGMDRETKVLPMIRYENAYVKVSGLGVEVKLPALDVGNGHRVKFGIVAKGEMNGYEASDAPILAGMEERKAGLWAGAKAEWQNDAVEVSAQWLADASSHSKGQRFSLGLEKSWRLSEQVMIAPHVTANWLDRKYVDYYYGVRADEVMAGRMAYTGKAGVNVDVGLRTMYRFDRSQSVMLDVATTRLSAAITDSPLVDRSNASRVVLGYMYRF